MLMLMRGLREEGAAAGEWGLGTGPSGIRRGAGYHTGMDDLRYDEPVGHAAPARGSRRLWLALGAALALLALAAGFFAYGRPDLLLDFANLRYCG